MDIYLYIYIYTYPAMNQPTTMDVKTFGICHLVMSENPTMAVAWIMAVYMYQYILVAGTAPKFLKWTLSKKAKISRKLSHTIHFHF